MIIYNGIKSSGQVHYIMFTNDKGKEIQVPIEEVAAKRIGMYLERLTVPTLKTVEFGNDEPSG